MFVAAREKLSSARCILAAVSDVRMLPRLSFTSSLKRAMFSEALEILTSASSTLFDVPGPSSAPICCRVSSVMETAFSEAMTMLSMTTLTFSAFSSLNTIRSCALVSLSSSESSMNFEMSSGARAASSCETRVRLETRSLPRWSSTEPKLVT